MSAVTCVPLFAQTGDGLLITPQGDAGLPALHAYLADQQTHLHRLMLEHGAILLRGFEVRDAADFHSSVKQLGARPFEYVGGNSPRTRVAPDVYSSTDYPASAAISLHNEMSYLPQWPRRLFFYSQLPAMTGGQTSLANSRAVLNAMPDSVVQKLRDKGVHYIRHFQPGLLVGKSWQATYQTEDRDELESIVRAQGSTCTWKADGALRVSTRCDAFASHPETGAQVWFNQAEQWHPSALPDKLRSLFAARGMLAHECEFADGEPMDEQMLAQMRQVINASKLLFDWQKNDVLMLDNLLMMHGREAFSGSRTTLAYLSST
ncbi:TauD/TfdA family dioxygenase [Rugamonas sp. CCM 8940]|uniref:TauD/TfdA family dioxygenase n=1 Tax=Rugamonas sp. CCM 8940 TaxID=2765359 RepID=UPI00351C5D53